MERFQIEGMTCSACSAHVERAVKQLTFVKAAQVSLLTNSMTVETADGASHAEEIALAIEEAGYHALPENKSSAEKTNVSQATVSPKQDMAHKLQHRFVASLIFMLPLMYVSMQHMLHYPIWELLNPHHYPMVNALAQLVLSTPVLYINRDYFRVGFKRLWKLSPNMDSLIAVGSSAAYFYGLFILFRMAVAYGNGNAMQAHGYAMELYFESAVMILTLITLGKFFEARAKKKTTSAIEKLMALTPDEVTLVLENGNTKALKTAEVKIGDVLLLRPGERVPVDGVLLEGVVALDQSHITGESMPVDKHAGDELIAGSMNPSASFRMRATKVGEDTTLSRIVKLVREAGDSKAPISKLADRVSGIFVPVVMGIALATFLLWLLAGQTFSFALSCAIAVLVISCPCALGLATPVAIMVGTGVGAQHGVLFRNGEVLETLHHIKSIVLDKTGTLTQGQMSVQTVFAVQAVQEEELLRVAAALEKGSEHPLAAAVTRYCEQKNVATVAVESFHATAGRGLSARISGVPCFAGNEKWMLENGIDLAPAQEELQKTQALGVSVLCFASNGKLLGLLGVSDTLKESSPKAVRDLKALGVTPYLLTGDQRVVAQTIAAQVGIEHVLAEVMPEDKAAKVRELQAGGARVAMVGDGINDAPALKQADVGIAVGAGTDIAIETADVVLASNRLTDVATAVRLSRSVIRNIKQNLFWAFFYNVVGIPIAAGLLYPAFGITLSPMLGAAAMSLSSVCVVSNALRLRRFRVEKELPSPAITEELQTSQEQGQPIIHQQKEEHSMEKIVHIEGMSCNHCKMSVEKALKALNGVENAEVDLEKKQAQITGATLDAAAIAAAITDAGFEFKGIE
ncbi:MAG: heavy metal translocating P-type ATPase [Clostridia bacterium]